MAMNADARIPFWKLLGNWDNVSWADCAVGFITFYHQLFKTGDPDAAYEKMKLASGNDDFGLWDGADVRAFSDKQRANASNHQNALLASPSTQPQATSLPSQEPSS